MISREMRLQIEPSDEMLLDRSSRGDWNAFEAIFSRYQKPVFEYVFLILENQAEAEDIFLGAFIQFFKSRELFFDKKISHQLLRIATVMLRLHFRKRKPPSENHSRQTQQIPLEARFATLLGYRFRSTVNEISWIMERQPSWVEDCLVRFENPRELSARELPNFLFSDYHATLRSKLEREISKGKKDLKLPLLIALTVALLAIYGGAHFFLKQPHKAARASFSPAVPEVKSPSPPPAPGKAVPIQVFLKDKMPVYKEDKSFVEFSYTFLPQKGKVLAVHYEFTSPDASLVGIDFKVRETDLRDYRTFRFSFSGEPDGCPTSLGIMLKHRNKIVFISSIPIPDPDAHTFEIALDHSSLKTSFFDTIGIRIKKSSAAMTESGKIYLSEICLVKKDQ